MAAEPILYINGSFKPLGEATISVLDQGFLLGDGVFDVVSAWRGVIFKLDEHIDRFFDSLRAARLETPMKRKDWRAAILETVRRNELQDATIRFIVTRGVPNGVVADPQGGAVQLYPVEGQPGPHGRLVFFHHQSIDKWKANTCNNEKKNNHDKNFFHIFSC